MIAVDNIAKLVGGTIIGDGAILVRNLAPIAFADKEDMTFAFSEEELEKAKTSNAACVLTTKSIDNYPKTILKIQDMKLAMTVIYNAMLEMAPPKKGTVHPSAIIDKTAKFGNNVSIGANCVIGKNVTIGENSFFYPNVTIYDYTVIGKRVTIHAGSVIGADGFGYIPKDDKIYKVPQLGRAIIEDDVEIGANTCIDRGTFSDTIIGKGAKIDNLVQVAHNVKIGRNVILAAQTGIAGSSTIGEGTMIGGQVGVADHVTVGRDVKIGAKTGVTGHVGDGKIIFGYPHREANEARKLHGLLSILIKYEKRLRKFLRTLPNEQ